MKQLFQKLTCWELWPFYIIYSPLAVVWLYYAFKAKAFWFFSPVNPSLEFSGFEGESKKEMYQQLPAALYPQTLFVGVQDNFTELTDKISTAKMHYPFIVKPQVGMQGMLFRKINNEYELKHYHSYTPFDYIIQEYIEIPFEYSVFHIRYPNEIKGRITGFLLKHYLFVTGDGYSTLLQLIRNHPRAKFKEEEMKHKHKQHLLDIIPVGEKYFLSIAGNHNRGANFINLHYEIDDKLCSVFDKISIESGQLYFGRYDLKCTSVEDLKEGKNISILEYNGVGAEPNHIYDCGMKYSKALRVIADHWRYLYEIGKINNKNGVLYWSFWRGHIHLRKAKRLFAKMGKYDLNYPAI